MNKVFNSVEVSSEKLQLCLGTAAGIFMRQLIYWLTSDKNDYGIVKNNRKWIYNTLEQWVKQIGTSKKTVQRAIKFLKENGLVESAHLAKNKRDRTLFYAVNWNELKNYLKNNEDECRQKTKNDDQINVHMRDHMYNNTDTSRSNKSKKIVKEVFKDLKRSSLESIDGVTVTKTAQTPPERLKITIVQDMLKIWNEEFPKSKIALTKRLARYLVAAFKIKFNSSLKEWKRYLRLLKTSAYLMGEKFKLFIDWAINFTNVDKLKSGWLGTKETKIPVDESEVAESTEQHVESVEETEKCKETRRKIIKKLSPKIYNSWFREVNLAEEQGRVFLKEPVSNRFLRDYIALNFLDKIGLEFLKSREQEGSTEFKPTRAKRVLQEPSSPEASRGFWQLKTILGRVSSNASGERLTINKSLVDRNKLGF